MGTKISFRVRDDVLTIYKDYSKEHKVTISKAINEVAREYKRLKEKSIGSASILKESEEVSSNASVSSQVQKPQTWYSDCPYATFLQTENKVYCDNPRKTKVLSKNRVIPTEVCDKCSERRSYIIQKKEIQIETQTETERGRYCILKATYLSLAKLPCIEDMDFQCPNKKCAKSILETIKKEW